MRDVFSFFQNLVANIIYLLNIIIYVLLKLFLFYKSNQIVRYVINLYGNRSNHIDFKSV